MISLKLRNFAMPTRDYFLNFFDFFDFFEISLGFSLKLGISLGTVPSENFIFASHRIFAKLAKFR